MSGEVYTHTNKYSYVYKWTEEDIGRGNGLRKIKVVSLTEK